MATTTIKRAIPFPQTKINQNTAYISHKDFRKAFREYLRTLVPLILEAEETGNYSALPTTGLCCALSYWYCTESPKYNKSTAVQFDKGLAWNTLQGYLKEMFFELYADAITPFNSAGNLRLYSDECGAPELLFTNPLRREFILKYAAPFPTVKKGC